MRVREERTACGVRSKKIEHVLHHNVHVFFFENSKLFCCNVELQRVQKLFRNA